MRCVCGRALGAWSCVTRGPSRAAQELAPPGQRAACTPAQCGAPGRRLKGCCHTSGPPTPRPQQRRRGPARQPERAHPPGSLPWAGAWPLWVPSCKAGLDWTDSARPTWIAMWRVACRTPCRISPRINRTMSSLPRAMASCRPTGRRPPINQHRPGCCPARLNQQQSGWRRRTLGCRRHTHTRSMRAPQHGHAGMCAPSMQTCAPPACRAAICAGSCGCTAHGHGRARAPTTVGPKGGTKWQYRRVTIPGGNIRWQYQVAVPESDNTRWQYQRVAIPGGSTMWQCQEAVSGGSTRRHQAVCGTVHSACTHLEGRVGGSIVPGMRTHL